MLHIPLLLCKVWSDDGPVPPEVVRPDPCFQSKSSPDWASVQVQRPCSKSQLPIVTDDRLIHSIKYIHKTIKAHLSTTSIEPFLGKRNRQI